MDISKILFWVFFILAIIFFVWYLFGKSPTLEQSLLIFILSLLFKQNNFVNGLKNKIGNLEKRMDKIEK